MSSAFAPCSNCSRHVKRGDSTCPFCGSEVPRVGSAPMPVAAARLSRSALLAASAAGLALTAATECSAPTPLPPYGLPPMIDGSWSTPADAGTSGDDTADAALNEEGSVQTVDGAEMPPTDSGSNTPHGEGM